MEFTEVSKAQAIVIAISLDHNLHLRIDSIHLRISHIKLIELFVMVIVVKRPLNTDLRGQLLVQPNLSPNPSGLIYLAKYSQIIFIVPQVHWCYNRGYPQVSTVT